jgi:hypothetical protein
VLDAAADGDAGLRELRRARGVEDELLKARRGAEWQSRVLKSLERFQAVATFALNIYEGMSVPRATAHTGGALAGAWAGVKASRFCGDAAAYCGAFLVPVGATAGEGAVDDVLQKIDDVTDASKIWRDWNP